MQTRSTSFEVKDVFGRARYERFQSHPGNSLPPTGRIEEIDGEDVFSYAGRICDNKWSNEVRLNFVCFSCVGQENKVVGGEIACSGFAVKVFFTYGSGDVKFLLVGVTRKQFIKGGWFMVG
uniref:Uncharacterized protein n=1 Tax=Romanomermis culicivorax TaxID=13658 RepID=A0A915L5C9_ROMCU